MVMFTGDRLHGPSPAGAQRPGVPTGAMTAS